MSENVIFCFSGSGNCLDIAKTIAKKLGDTDIVMMRREPAYTDASHAKRVGFIFPDYAGGLYHIDDSILIVSRGLCKTGIVPRFCNRPEVVVIELHPETSEGR